jgi:hypothetical protein
VKSAAPSEQDVGPQTKIHIAATAKEVPSELRQAETYYKPPAKFSTVLIPKFKEITPVLYPSEPVKSTIRRSERILDRLDASQISPLGRRPLPRASRSKAEAKCRRVLSNLEEEEEEVGDSDSGSTQTHSESREEGDEDMDEEEAGEEEDEEEEVDEEAEEGSEEDEGSENGSAEEEDERPVRQRAVVRNALPSSESVRVKAFFVKRGGSRDSLVFTMRRSSPLNLVTISRNKPEPSKPAPSKPKRVTAKTPSTLKRSSASGQADTGRTSNKRRRVGSSREKANAADSRSDPKDCAALFKENASNVVVALSGFERARKLQLERIVTDLGGQTTEAVEGEAFSHLVLPSAQAAPRPRTRKVWFGIAQGAFIVTDDWLEQSQSKTRFVDAARFELGSEFPGAAWRRKRRSGQGLLKGKSVLIRGRPIISQEDLVRVIELADGRVVTSAEECDFLVGPEHFFREAQRMKVPFLADTALLDALCAGKPPL